MGIFFLFWLIVAALPIVLPIVSLVRTNRTRSRVEQLERRFDDQQRQLESLRRQVTDLRKGAEAPAPTPLPAPTPAPAPAPIAPAPVAPRPVAPPPAALPPIAPPPPAPPPEFKLPSLAIPEFDWESLIGVKLFSAIAGIALVIAAIFFLRYSIEHGWLEPPVRVAIGVIVSIGLLIVCEWKIARDYRITANALDAAAIAILFATFFAANALWHLISGGVAFGLLALVTAVAVGLSIRRDSIFIAVLGLLGGFATPVLLSTGENRPIPLFTYLLLLNIGLAWVAYRKRWPALSTLTVVLTALYQWGWVFRFLSTSQLPLAAGIFLLFPLVTMTALVLGRPDASTGRGNAGERTFERTALGAAGLPLLFAVYLAAVPAYGHHAGILFGLLLIVDIGLFVVSLARREPLVHSAGAIGTLVVVTLWLTKSYAGDSYAIVLAILPLLVAHFLFAPEIARRLDRDWTGAADRTVFVAPLLLAAFPILAGSEHASNNPLPLFAVLLVLTALLAWRALSIAAGPLYYIAAFFVVVSEAVWLRRNLDGERLPVALLIYAAWGVLSIGVPVLARRRYQPLAPRGGMGAVLLASLVTLLFLAAGPITGPALWGLALLIATLDAALFVEAASGQLPGISIAGGTISWFVLAVWLSRSAAIVGVLPSLLVVVMLTLVMLAGYGWSYAQSRTPLAGFRTGLYLGLAGYLFLAFIATDARWSIPPWPLFGALSVITLAVGVTSLYTRTHQLYIAGLSATMTVALLWSDTARIAPWPLAAILAAAAGVLFSLAWIRIARRFEGTRQSEIAAGIALFIFQGVVIAASGSPGAPSIAVIIAAHTVSLAILLQLVWTARWTSIAPLAVAPAALALMAWQATHPAAEAWPQLLSLAAAFYAVFMAYPFALRSRARDTRDPYLAAVLASGVCFFAARAAFVRAGLGWMVGAVPVFEGAMLALLLRLLLRIQPPGTRDIGRLALVAGASMAFITVAIPLQLQHQWITIGWALEGAALAWLFRRIPHRGLLYSAAALLAVVFVRLAMNPAIFQYEPRGSMRILNWYLYTYVICAAAFFAAARMFSKTSDRIGTLPWRLSQVVPAAGVILLFIVLNIEIADFYATGPEIMFKFGSTLAQDLTYTFGWLGFGIILLVAGIYMKSHPGRIAALALIAVTTFKCFLYDLSSLGGLYRIASFVGLAFALTLVSLALQRYVLRAPKEA